MRRPTKKEIYKWNRLAGWYLEAKTDLMNERRRDGQVFLEDEDTYYDDILEIHINVDSWSDVDENPFIWNAPIPKEEVEEFVEDMLCSLSPAQRIAIEGRINGLTFQQIVDKHGGTRQNHYQNYRKGIKILKERINSGKKIYEEV